MAGKFFGWLAVVLLTACLSAAEPLRFMVLSDMQPGVPGGWKVPGEPYYYVDKVYEQGLAAGADAFLICGDISGFSEREIYEEFRAIWDARTKDLAQPPAWLPVMGNHDYWEEVWNPKKVLSDDPYGKRPETAAARTALFQATLKLDTVNPHVVIKGVDFIGISQDVYASSTKENLERLEACLQKAVERDPSKPIIVFAHNNVTDTVYGSGSGGSKAMYELLAKYPQVIYFSGHTHFPLEDERTIHQGDFTSVATSSMSLTYLDEPSVEFFDRNLGKNALMVTIDDKQVEIRRFQLRDGSEILDDGKPWVLPLPLCRENFVYEPARRAAAKPAPAAPVFPEGAVLKAEPALNAAGEFTGVTLTGTAATHPKFVHSYRVDIAEKQADGSWKECKWTYRRNWGQKDYKQYPDERLLVFSDFYAGLNFMKPEFKTTIPVYPPGWPWQGFDFQADTTYRLTVTAVESYGTESKTTLQTEVTLPANRVADPTKQQ